MAYCPDNNFYECNCMMYTCLTFKMKYYYFVQCLNYNTVLHSFIGSQDWSGVSNHTSLKSEYFVSVKFYDLSSHHPLNLKDGCQFEK